jgi:Fur family peroxide stress response transcriptional regulator
MNNYTEILRAHNLKATPQRIEIANALYKDGHMSIDNLYNRLKQKFQSISLATIYKNINIMMDASFIQEVKIPHAKSVYELTKETHSHLVCSKCGEVEDITLNLGACLDEVSHHTHFQVEKTNLVLTGVCHNCQV